MASNLGVGRHGLLALTMTAEDYLDQTSHVFILPHNPGYYPPKMGTSQEQVLRIERFRQNQALFRRCTTVDGELIKQIVMAVKLVYLYPMVDQLTGFGQVTELQTIHNLFNSYREIDEIDPEENAVNMMGPYETAEPLDHLIEKL